MKMPIRQLASADLPTRWGRFRILGFELHRQDDGEVRPETAVAVVMGDLTCNTPLLRIHSQCLTGNAFSSLRCDCGDQLRASLEMIAQEGSGLVIYEEKQSRGIGMIPTIQACELQDDGCDSPDAHERPRYRSDYRDYSLPVQILHHLEIRRVRLITNNPEKLQSLTAAGIAVDGVVPCKTVPPVEHGRRYLQAQMASHAIEPIARQFEEPTSGSR
jgi:GTP cyclohydrolase II